MRPHTRLWLPTVSLGLGLVFSGAAQALTDAEAEKILSILHPDAQSLAELQKQFPAFKKKAKSKNHASNGTAAAPITPVKAAPQAGVGAGAGAPTASGGSQLGGLHFMLRNDWADLGLLAPCIGGVSTSAAKGASLSFTQNYVTANRIWAAQGMVAAVYSECNEHLRPYADTGLFEKSIAAYAQVNSSYNSNLSLASKNMSTTTAGLSGEIAYLTQTADYNIGRITPNVVQDEIKGTTAVAAMGQYIPAWVSYPGLWNPAFALNSISYQFDPTLDLQFASTTGNKPLLFSGKDQSLRVGPELTLLVAPFALGENVFLRQIGVNVTFHPWYEVYSSRGNYWWTNAITYNLTDNVSVGVSYSRGLDENSGELTNQYMVTLNGKL